MKKIIILFLFIIFVGIFSYRHFKKNTKGEYKQYNSSVVAKNREINAFCCSTVNPDTNINEGISFSYSCEDWYYSNDKTKILRERRVEPDSSCIQTKNEYCGNISKIDALKYLAESWKDLVASYKEEEMKCRFNKWEVPISIFNRACPYKAKINQSGEVKIISKNFCTDF